MVRSELPLLCIVPCDSCPGIAIWCSSKAFSTVLFQWINHHYPKNQPVSDEYWARTNMSLDFKAAVYI